MIKSEIESEEVETYNSTHIMKNELAINGEKISERIYPELFSKIGMIRGEYLLRELNKSILTKEGADCLENYLKKICLLYDDQEVWYRLSELTSAEINILDGTKKIHEENHPLMGMRGLRRSLEEKSEFSVEVEVIKRVSILNKNMSIFLPFVNDSVQLKEGIEFLRKNGYHGKIGCMIEIPSAYFDLKKILELDIDRIVVGLNDFTSFIFGASRGDKWHDMEGELIISLINDMHEKANLEKKNVSSRISKQKISRKNKFTWN